MLATHECSALHKDFVPLTFTFHSMVVELNLDYVTKAEASRDLPAELRLELARAGRSVISTHCLAAACEYRVM